MRFHIPMHDSFAVTEVEGLAHVSAAPEQVTSHTNLQQFQNVVAYIKVSKFGIETSEVRIVDVLEDKGRSLALRIPDDIQERDNIGAPRQILQDFDLPLDFLLLHRFEDFDDAFLVVHDIDPFKHF